MSLYSLLTLVWNYLTLFFSPQFFNSKAILVAEILCCISTVPILRKLMCLTLEINAHTISLKMAGAIIDKCRTEEWCENGHKLSEPEPKRGDPKPFSLTNDRSRTLAWSGILSVFKEKIYTAHRTVFSTFFEPFCSHF